MRRLAIALLLLPAALALAAGTGDRPLRVGSSGDYAPFSVFTPGEPAVWSGFDVAVARAYAADRDRGLELVRFAWPGLLAALAGDRFDLAMSGVTVRPERSAAGRFSVPVVESAAVVLVRESERFPDLDALDRRAARVGVNAGGHLERVAAERLPRATLVAIPDNAAVIRALREGAVDAVVTDDWEASHWGAQLEGGALLGPLSRDRKAYLVSAGAPELAADLDTWLLEREADGSLARLRREHLGGGAEPVATPLGALLAAVDERLALMPLVGTAKRRSGLPLEVPEREALVLDAAVAGALAAASRRGVAPPDAAAVRALFRAQMEAAKQVQWAAVKDPDFAPPAALPDLEDALRPGLLRIGDRIAELLVVLPPDLDPAGTREAARAALRTPRLSERSIDSIADAITALSHAPRE